MVMSGPLLSAVSSTVGPCLAVPGRAYGEPAAWPVVPDAVAREVLDQPF
jgi:hypothetical protein